MAKLVSPKKIPNCLNDFTNAEHEIYKLYPRSKGKDHAFEGLRKIRWAIRDIGGDLDVATAHLKARVVAWAAKSKRVGTEDEFIPMCKTWMGQRRYLDEPEAVPKKSFHPGTCFERCVRCNTRAPLGEMRLEVGGYVCRGGCREESQA